MTNQHNGDKDSTVFDSNQYENESAIVRKSRENPVFPIAMTGFACIVLYGAYKFRYRGDMPVSLYLIHLRMAAQGFAISTITCGMLYSIGKRLYNNYYKIPNIPEEHR